MPSAETNIYTSSRSKRIEWQQKQVPSVFAATIRHSSSAFHDISSID
ncbi:hypothetical protein Tco_0434047, partial [Tanacetum coccineum]